MVIDTVSKNIAEFKGDVIIYPCDCDLTYRKTLLEKAGDRLLKEMNAIGFCKIGNAVITQGYELRCKHIVFIPIINHETDETIDSNTLHTAIHNAFTLAELYKLKTIGIASFQTNRKRGSTIDKLKSFLFTGDYNPEQRKIEVEDMINAIAKNFNNTSIEKITIFK